MNKRPKSFDIPLLSSPVEGELFPSASAVNLNEDPSENSDGSEISPTLNQCNAFMTESSDYSKFPANLQLAKERARNHKIRDRKRYIDRGRLPLWKNKENLMKYSMTSYFYFDFMEQGINILLITFFFCGLFDLVTILVYPSKEQQTTSFVFDISTLSIHYFPALLTIKVSLAMLNLILIKIYSLIKEKNRIKKYLHLKNISQNYFSVMVQGLPLDLDMTMFYNFLSSHLNGKAEEKIRKVIHLQDNQEKNKLLKHRKEVYVKMLHAPSETAVAEFQQELEKIDNEIAVEDQKLANNQRFNGTLIIIFQDTYTAIRVLKKWNKVTFLKRVATRILQKFGYDYLRSFEFEGRFLNIEKAGEPFDIEWQNSGKSESNIILRSAFASFVLWGAVSIYPLINISVAKPTVNDHDLLKNVWNYTPYIIVIILINLAIVLLINFLSIFSGLRRKSDVEKRKIAMKVAFNFISYGLLISAKAFMDSMATPEVNQVGGGSERGQNAKESLVNTISLLMFYLIFLPQILELLDVEWIYKFLRRKYYLRKNDFSSLSQGELDEIMKQPYFDYSTRVSNVAQTIFLGLVSAPIFPLAPLLAICALYAALVVDRYLILRRCSDWKIVGTNLGISFPKAFSYNVFVQVMGVLLFLVLIDPKSNDKSASQDQFQYVMVFVMGLGYIYCFAKYLSPVMMKHAYADLKVSNMIYNEEESRFKISYEELYQSYLTNGK